MMGFKLGKYSDLLELIGIFCIFGSLIFVGVQVKLSQEISFAEQDLVKTEIDSSLRREMNLHADIWNAGNSGEELDENSQLIFENLVRNIWDRAHSIAEARARVGSSANIEIHEFAVFLSKNPGAKQLWFQIIEEELAARDLLGYRTGGFGERVDMVYADLETLEQ